MGSFIPLSRGEWSKLTKEPIYYRLREFFVKIFINIEEVIMPVLTQYFFGIASWSVELALWGLVLIALPVMVYLFKIKVSSGLNDLLIIFIMIGAVMVWLPYLYFLINNYEVIVVTIGLMVVVFAIYPSLVERRRKTFLWKIKSQSNLGFFVNSI